MLAALGRAARVQPSPPLHLILAGWWLHPPEEAIWREQASVFCPEVRLHILDGRDEAVQRQIRDHFTQHPGLRAQRDLLTSIPGIGETTAAVLIAELFDKPYASARQAAAFAGVVPRVAESGTLRARGRLVKLGPGRLRKALYFPALAALRFNPTLRALRERMRHAGKPPMVIVGAAMRKLIHLAFGVLKSGRTYNPTYARA